MATVATILDSGTIASAATKVTASVSAAAGDDIVVAFGVMNHWAGPYPAVTATGLTFTLTEERGVGGWAQLLVYRAAVAAPFTGTITFDPPSTGNTGPGAYAVVKVTESAGLGQTAQDGYATADTQTINYGSTWGAGSIGLAFFMVAGGAFDAAPRAGWTELAEIDSGSDLTLQVQTRTSADTAAGVTWSPSTGGADKYAVVLEFDPAGGGGDTTPPTLSSPTAAQSGSTTGTGSVSTNEGNGTLSWVVTTSSTSPSAAQVRAGQDHTGAAAVDSGSQAVSGTGVQSVTGGFSGLSPSTTYYAHYQHRDAASNDSTVSTSASFTTAAGGGGSANPAVIRYIQQCIGGI